MSSISFRIKSWSAWTPGIATFEQWQAWSQGHLAIADDAQYPSPTIPAMLRRRLSPLGKMALAVAVPLLSDLPTPSVFSSRHGELNRTIELLKSLANHEALSPTHFSLSVHNAIGGVLSIARQDTSPITAIATQEGDVSIALMEAATILNEGAHREVLCVIYDEPLPALYERDNCPAPYAAAFLIGPDSVTDNEAMTRLTLSLDASSHSLNPEPSALSLLRFLLDSKRHSLTLATSRMTWHWQKDLALDTAQ